MQVRIHVGHNDEALLGKNLRRLDGFVIVRQQVLAVLDDFDFDKISVTKLACKAGDAYCLVSCARTAGVGQQGDVFRYVVKNVGKSAAVGTAQGEREDFCACLLYGGLD